MLGADQPDRSGSANRRVHHGQSFATREVTENLAAQLPGAASRRIQHRPAAHGRRTAETDTPATPRAASIELAAHGYDYWALGHVHQREVLLRDPVDRVFRQHCRAATSAKPARRARASSPCRTAASPRSSIASSTWSAGALLDLTRPVGRSRHRCRAWPIVRGGLDAALAKGGGRPLVVEPRVARGRVRRTARWCAISGPTRDMLRVEAAAAAGTGAIWLEGVQVRTRPALDIAAMRERSDAVGMLVREIDGAGPERFVEPMKQYFGGLLGKASGLRPALHPDHPAIFRRRRRGFVGRAGARQEPATGPTGRALSRAPDRPEFVPLWQFRLAVHRV